MEPDPDVSPEDKEIIFANLHMPISYDAQCKVIKQLQEDAFKITRMHFIFCTHESCIKTEKDVLELCRILSLKTIEDISNLSIDYITYNFEGNLKWPDRINFSRLILKCRIVEGHSYEARFDMSRSAKDLLYKYGLIEAFYIAEKLKLKTFNDIKDLSDTQINSLLLPKIEQNKLVELRDACVNNETYKAFCIAQADKVLEYANARWQIERKFMHARQDKALALRAAAKIQYLYAEQADKTVRVEQVEQVNPICFIEFEINRSTVLAIIDELSMFEQSCQLITDKQSSMSVSNELKLTSVLKKKLISNIQYMDYLTNSHKQNVFKTWLNGQNTCMYKIMNISPTEFLSRVKKFSTELTDYVDKYSEYFG